MPLAIHAETLPKARLRVTSEGWYWLLSAVVLLGTGLYKGINLLTLLACLMLAVWALHGWSSARRIRMLRGRRCVQEPVFAGKPAALEVVLQNTWQGAQVGVVIEERGPSGPLVRPVPTLGGGASTAIRWEIVGAGRGLVTVGPLTASSRLPFGLFRRSATLAPEEQVWVLPALGQVHRGKLRRRLALTAFTLGRGRHFARRHPAAQADLHGLRSFRSGDSPRWIHWPTTARAGELMVREFEETPTENLTVVLEPGNPAAPAGYEEVIRLAATVCWEWCRQTGDRLALAVAGPRPDIVSGLTGRDLALRLLRRLAELPPAPAGDGVALVEYLASCELPPGPVLVVGTGPDGPADLLAERLRRPVTPVDACDPDGHDFYERDASDAP
jgi:uncharacterized protein (DUF58 family)